MAKLINDEELASAFEIVEAEDAQELSSKIKKDQDIDEAYNTIKAEKKKTKAEEEKENLAIYKKLFGSGFEDDEYLDMGSRYETLKDSYTLRTSMHSEALVTYIKYAFKRDKAIADDDIDAADKWGKLASKQANDAKINPNQLSAADLSSGMTCFSQVSATVEKEQDIIPLLNTFIDQPEDKVDYTIWQYINYTRNLVGKPDVKYRDIYNFLYKRAREQKRRLKFDPTEPDGHYDEEDLGD